MANLKEKGLSLLVSKSAVNLNVDADTALYTVPTGKTACITHVVLRDVSADSTNCVFTLGQSGAKTDWATSVAAGVNLDGTTKQLVLTRHKNEYYDGSDTWDAGSIADHDMEAKDVTVTGAAVGDFAVAAMGVDVTDLCVSAQVTVANTVTVVLSNSTSAAVDLASTTVYARAYSRLYQPLEHVEYTAGLIFTLDITTAAGVACTCTVDVFGYLY